MLHFAQRDAWVFDLDNTLYPHETGLMNQVSARITQFCANFFSLPPDEARVIQKQFYHHYGTTLAGLIAEHGVNPQDYFNFVHNIDYSVLAANPDLRRHIEALPGSCFVFTNADARHMERCLIALGLDGLFAGLEAASSTDYQPKPALPAYQRFARKHGLQLERGVFFEDNPQNLKPAHQLGMATVLVETPYLGGNEEQPLDYVDVRTKDLTDFLGRMLASR